jgi:hypothetical protein
MSAIKTDTLAARTLAAAVRCYRQARRAVEKGDPALVARRLNEALLQTEAAERLAGRPARKSRAAS